MEGRSCLSFLPRVLVPPKVLVTKVPALSPQLVKQLQDKSAAPTPRLIRVCRRPSCVRTRDSRSSNF
jgi:hypothetical protein